MTQTDDRELLRKLDRTPVPYTATRVIPDAPRVLVCYYAAGWRRVCELPNGRVVVQKAFVWDGTQEGLNHAAK